MVKIKFIPILVILIMLVSVNCLSASTVIHRDDYGVAHIYSQSLEGLYYGWGYASAQDRLFQLEMLKRTYYGRVSEIFGPDYFSLDFYWKNEYPDLKSLQEQYNQLAPKYQTIMAAYANGINAWIDEVNQDPEDKLPLEFHRLGILPKHWTPLDTAAALMANLGLFMDLTNEILHSELYTQLIDKFGNKADSYFNDIAWLEDPKAYTTIQNNTTKNSTLDLKTNTQLALLNKEGLKQLSKSYQGKANMISQLLAVLGYETPLKIHQNAVEAMSYAVAIAPEKSATGNALLMAGPQVDYWVPGLMYEVGLHGAGFDVVGITLIGSPYLMFGETRTTAFTCTAGADNTIDIYEEQLNPANPTQYLYKGKWVDMEIKSEEIKIKGEEARDITFYKTVHGPVLVQVDTDRDGKNDIAYSKRNACADGYLSAVASYTELMLADTPEKFIAAASLLEPTLNYIYADNSGNIGYYHCGKFPIRPTGIDLRLPTPGSGEYEWLGFLTPEEHPQIINPESGFVVNWNNKPAPDFNNGDLTSIFSWTCWSEDHRSFNLDRLIREKTPISVQDLADTIHEISDAELQAYAVKDFLLEALADSTDPKLMKVKNLLASWDNQRSDQDHDGYYDSVGLTIFQEWWQIVNREVFGDILGQYMDLGYHSGGVLINYGGYSLFVRTILGEKASIPVNNDYYNGRGWKPVFIESLKQTLAQLQTKYGTADMSKWTTEVMMMPFPATHISGSPSGFGAVYDIPFMDRGSENHIVNCTWPIVTGQNVVPPGQSGFINLNGVPDKHFQDQLALYRDWEYKKMLITKGDVLINSQSTDILIFRLEF